MAGSAKNERGRRRNGIIAGLTFFFSLSQVSVPLLRRRHIFRADEIFPKGQGIFLVRS